MPSLKFTITLILLMTVFMGVALSGWFTYAEMGFAPGFARAWVDRFVSTYVIVLPTVVVVSPVAQWLARRIAGPSP